MYDLFTTVTVPETNHLEGREVYLHSQFRRPQSVVPLCCCFWPRVRWHSTAEIVVEEVGVVARKQSV